VKAARVVKPLSQKKLQKYQAEHENRGVCYLSRVPPYLKPSALREMLSGMGTDVLRVYLAAEENSVRTKRVKAGGNKKKSFTEGWVEFSDKKRAMRIARTLNNSKMTPPNNHRSFYAHDLWNIKYLHKFKWNHLSEKASYEARVKQDKMRDELAQAKKETSFYLKKVGQAKAIEAMSERRKRKATAAEEESTAKPKSGTTAAAAVAAAAAAAGGTAAAKRQKRTGGASSEAAAAAAGGAAADSVDSAEGLRAVRRRFKQRQPIYESGGADGRQVDIGLLKSVLGEKAQ